MRNRRQKPSYFRILIVEDDPERERTLLSWMTEGVRTVVAGSAGQAIGILKRDRGRVYGGIVLDHDLDKRKRTEEDFFLSGRDVMESIIRNIDRDVPVLVHSVNTSQSVFMANRLFEAGFLVERIPMTELSREKFCEWLEYARALWNDYNDNDCSSFISSQ